jgi:hypothetical protein
MTEQTREAIDNYLAAAKKPRGEFLFGGRRGRDRPITTRQYVMGDSTELALPGINRVRAVPAQGVRSEELLRPLG